ncbi:cupin domain-containing protein [Opitutaceae bacterium TAV1]|nr:cupin domain-containing protein [Opitutaceae bacterium TAV1]
MPQSSYTLPEDHTAFLARKIHDDRRLECIIALVGPGGGRIADHAHAHDHLIYVIDGSVTVRFDGNDIVVGKDQTLLVPAGTLHAIRNPDHVAAARIVRIEIRG